MAEKTPSVPLGGFVGRLGESREGRDVSIPEPDRNSADNMLSKHAKIETRAKKNMATYVSITGSLDKD
jgi:hypothetical protein